MKAESLPDGSYRIELDEPPVSIEFYDRACTDVDCPCRDATLVCDCDGLGFEVDTDVDHWRLQAVKPDRSDVRELAEALLQGVVQTVGRQIKWKFEQKYADQRVEAHRMPAQAVRGGEVISLLQVVSGTPRPTEEFGVSYGLFEVDGRSFVTDVYYCANPKCGCREAHPMFLEFWSDPKAKIEGQVGILHLSWGFDGRTEILEKEHLSQEQAEHLIRAWTRKHPKMDTFKAEYAQAKQIGRRSLRDAAPAPAASAKPGRNDPCPCGSGKKYKRCCGA